MRKILTFSLLLSLFLVPVIGQASDKEEELGKKYNLYLIRSFGWKCDKIISADIGQMRWGSRDKAFRPDEKIFNYVKEITCQNGKLYYMKNLAYDYQNGYRWKGFLCHEGICKEF